MKVRHKLVGVDLYEIQIKKNVFSSWTTIYDGSLPLRVSKDKLSQTKVAIISKFKK